LYHCNPDLHSQDEHDYSYYHLNTSGSDNKQKHRFYRHHNTELHPAGNSHASPREDAPIAS
jgi:hypothetical protein